MTLTGKIKQALHLDKDKTTDTTTGSATGAGHRSADTTAPQTGPEAYQPLSKGTDGTTGGTTTQGGTTAGSANKLSGGHGGSTATTGGASNAGYDGGEYETTGSGTTGGVTGTGSRGDGVSGSRSTGGVTEGGQGGGLSSFKQGYTEGEPGYSSGYRSGEPLYKESVQRGNDGSWSAELEAGEDNKHWAQARELTLAAEREVATAKLSGKKAQVELEQAEKAEKAVRTAQIKHREALEEAEKYRTMIGDPSLKEHDLEDARSLYTSRREAANQAENELKTAEADLAQRKRDYESLHPKVEQYGQTLPSLEDDLASRHRDVAGAEDEKARLLAALKDAEANRNSHAGELESLEREVDQAERAAAAKQQEYIELRNAAQNAASRLDALRTKLRALDDELMGHYGRVKQAEDSLPGYLEAEERARRELENAQSEWYRLKELEDEYSRGYTSAHDKYKSLHSSHGPASRELQDSHSLLRAREDDLARSRERAASAEKKYRELLNLADRHKKYGDTAADAAQAHGEKYEALKREAEIHGDKHKEYWNAARQEGEVGSSTATETIHKLEQRVKELMNKSEP